MTSSLSGGTKSWTSTMRRLLLLTVLVFTKPSTAFRLPDPARCRKRTRSSAQVNAPRRLNAIVKPSRGPPFSKIANQREFVDVVQPVTLFVLHSFLLALLTIGWEDYTSTYTLPSRGQRARVLAAERERRNVPWGAASIGGLAFGQNERLLLPIDQVSLRDRPSYNEAMLEHRQERVTRWHEMLPMAATAQAVHTVCEALAAVLDMQQLAKDYQWERVRLVLQSPVLGDDLATASSQLRISLMSCQLDSVGSVEDVVGFDWGSCAWRHCGALADAQEALDELDALLGVLEPREALFCLDVVERSLRDMLTVVMKEGSGLVADVAETDKDFWHRLSPYQPIVSTEEGDVDVLDDAYFKALKELSVEL